MSRHEYIEKIKQQLNEWEQDIDRLEDKLADVRDDLRLNYEEKISELKVKKDEAISKARQLEEATEEAWDDLKDGLEMAWDSLKLGFLAAKSEFMGDKEDKKD